MTSPISNVVKTVTDSVTDNIPKLQKNGIKLDSLFGCSKENISKVFVKTVGGYQPQHLYGQLKIDEIKSIRRLNCPSVAWGIVYEILSIAGTAYIVIVMCRNVRALL